MVKESAIQRGMREMVEFGKEIGSRETISKIMRFLLTNQSEFRVDEYGNEIEKTVKVDELWDFLEELEDDTRGG